MTRLRALLDEHGVDWRAGHRADDRVIARRLINYGTAYPPEQWEKKIADVLREMREAGASELAAELDHVGRQQDR